MVNELENRLVYAKTNTTLPDKPNLKRISDFVYSINQQIITQGNLDILKYTQTH